MYCINCGVKLADTEKRCPLCGVEVFHPDLSRPAGEPLYPRYRYPTVQIESRTALVIVTVLFLLPILITLLCDLQITGGITWSGFAAGALILVYELIVLPFWFRSPNPVVFVPCGFAAIGLYVLYINFAVAGNWFLSFAFPLIGFLGLLTTAVVTLVRYIRWGRLFIFGGAALALGLFMPVMELLIMLTFALPKFTAWSLFPLIPLVLLGGLLIFLGIHARSRDVMEQKFFI